MSQEENPKQKEKTGFRAILANLWAKITSAFSSLFASLRKLWGSKAATPQTEAPRPQENSKPASSLEPKDPANTPNPPASPARATGEQETRIKNQDKEPQSSPALPPAAPSDKYLKIATYGKQLNEIRTLPAETKEFIISVMTEALDLLAQGGTQSFKEAFNNAEKSIKTEGYEPTPQTYGIRKNIEKLSRHIPQKSDPSSKSEKINWNEHLVRHGYNPNTKSILEPMTLAANFLSKAEGSSEEREEIEKQLKKVESLLLGPANSRTAANSRDLDDDIGQQAYYLEKLLPQSDPTLAPAKSSQTAEEARQARLQKVRDLTLDFTSKGFRSSTTYSGDDIRITFVPQTESPITPITQSTKEAIQRRVRDLTMEFAEQGFKSSVTYSGDDISITITPQTEPVIAQTDAMLQGATTREQRETGPRAGTARDSYNSILDLLQQAELLVQLQICSNDEINAIREKSSSLNAILVKYLEDGTNPKSQGGEEMLKKLPRELSEFLETTFKTCMIELTKANEEHLRVGREIDSLKCNSSLNLTRVNDLNSEAKRVVARINNRNAQYGLYQIGDAKDILPFINELRRNIQTAQVDIARHNQAASSAASPPPGGPAIDAPSQNTATTTFSYPDILDHYKKNIRPTRRNRWNKKLTQNKILKESIQSFLDLMTEAYDCLQLRQGNEALKIYLESLEDRDVNGVAVLMWISELREKLNELKKSAPIAPISPGGLALEEPQPPEPEIKAPTKFKVEDKEMRIRKWKQGLDEHEFRPKAAEPVLEYLTEAFDLLAAGRHDPVLEAQVDQLEALFELPSGMGGVGSNINIAANAIYLHLQELKNPPPPKAVLITPAPKAHKLTMADRENRMNSWTEGIKAWDNVDKRRDAATAMREALDVLIDAQEDIPDLRSVLTSTEFALRGKNYTFVETLVDNLKRMTAVWKDPIVSQPSPKPSSS